MKAMKNLGVNRMLGSVRRRTSPSPSAPVPSNGPEAPPLDTPEANAQRGVTLFCESGGPNSQRGEEVLYLPTIVEAAESSPAAAKECAYQIRKFLSKDFGKPHIHYNAIMLTRILSDNPGRTFTKNIDAKFISTVKELLRIGTDPSVKQLLMETLDNFDKDKKDDENLVLLSQMWRKEQVRMTKMYGPRNNFPPQQNMRRSRPSSGLPSQAELASRIEESRNTAKILTQLVQSTPPEEILANDLIREFADRCRTASRSVQGYMAAENPPPDNDTMLTLIETNEQLVLAQSKHSRAVLSARKALGFGNGDGVSPSGSGNGNINLGGRPQADGEFTAPSGPPPSQSKLASTAPALPKNKPTVTVDGVEDPFRDPVESAPARSGRPSPEPIPTTTHNPPFPAENGSRSSQDGRVGPDGTLLSAEPYHPGFKETRSYVGRQDSSIGKVTMHAAGPVEEDEEEDEEEIEARRRKPVFRY